MFPSINYIKSISKSAQPVVRLDVPPGVAHIVLNPVIAVVAHFH